jgi:hypothetical protein
MGDKMIAVILLLASGIAHEIRQDLVRYYQDAEKEASIPREYIPGGLPDTRSYRLTDWSNLSMAGTVDALLRRRHASIAFGLSGIKDYHVSSHTGSAHYVLAAKEDWVKPTFTHDLFNLADSGEKWITEASRDYAVTNHMIVVTNWVGYVTNVVSTTTGVAQVTISNRYKPIEVMAVDTRRIGSRLLESLNAVRQRSPHSIYRLINPDGGSETWPKHNTFSTTNDFEFRDQFIGWSSPGIINIFAINQRWSERVVDENATDSPWRRFYVTLDEMFNPGALTDRKIKSVIEWPLSARLLGYDEVCADYWEDWLSEANIYPESNTNAPNQGVYSICKILDIEPPAKTNEYKYIPDYAVKGRRIIYHDWAIANAFLAMADTALINSDAMPKLHYTHAETTIVARAEWPDIPLPACELRWTGYGYRAVFPNSINIDIPEPNSLEVSPGSGQSLTSPYNVAGVDFYPDAAVETSSILASNTAEQYSKANSLHLSHNAIEGFFINLAQQSPPEVNVGDKFYIRFNFLEFPGRHCEVRLHSDRTGFSDIVNIWMLDVIPTYFTSLSLSAYRGATFVRTTEVAAYDYTKLERGTTNSVPMIYPNPNYGVDDVKSIDAQAIMCVAASINRHYHSDGIWGDTPEHYALAFEASPHQASSDVDSWFRHLDRSMLQPKVREMAKGATGVDFDAPLERALLDSFDDVKAAKDWIAQSITNRLCHLSLISPIDHFVVTGVNKNPDNWMENWATVEARDSSGNPISIDDGLYFYMMLVNPSEDLDCPVGIRTGGANGSLSGLGAVHWDFKTMKRADD